jgi:hypothetical protein
MMVANHVRRRLAQSIILGRMLLVIARAISVGYRPDGRHIGATFPEVLVGTSVFVRDHRHHKPVSARTISRDTGIPHSNVLRYAALMVRQGILIKTKDGYTFSPSYISERQNGRAVRSSIAAVLWAARELLKLV